MAYRRNPAYDLSPRIWNLYVARLDDKAREHNHKSPTHDNDGKNTDRCIYVGCTQFSEVEKRLDWHKNDPRTTKNIRREYFEFLMPGLYEHLNIGAERGLETYEQATRRELELAKELESKGYTVWCYTN